MKKPYYLLSIVFLMICIANYSCTTPSSLYKQGYNESAINLAAERLRYKKRLKDIIVLEAAFNEHVKPSLDKIEFLKKEGNPENWPTIYAEYAKIKSIQEKVKPLLPLYIEKEFRNADIKLINIDEEVLDAKRKAAEYTYASAMKLMDVPGKSAKRQAYYKFMNVKSYYENYKDTDEQLKRAHDLGVNYVILGFADNSNMLIPKEFVKQMMSVPIVNLNSLWVNYHADTIPSYTYDYKVIMNVNDINISAEKISERDFTEEKVVEDGWEYVLDSKGNVKKDSLGNDIKIKKYKTIRGTVRESSQLKAGYIAGVFEYNDLRSQQLIRSIPFKQELVFSNVFSKLIKGNIDALSKESRAKLGGGPLPFPSNEKLIMDAAALVKNSFADCLRTNVDVCTN